MHILVVIMVLLTFLSTPTLAKKCVSGSCDDGIGTQLFSNGLIFSVWTLTSIRTRRYFADVFCRCVMSMNQCYRNCHFCELQSQ